ncbi:MAG TPA: PDZ domain-containing protein [Candidatus Scatomorpha stercoravium]|nr:PDZ domain-containing protein [Candidatus Scatomorpha stercoravium]
MKNGFGRVVKAFFGIKIRFWALILACVLCVGVTYGLTVQRERGRIGSEENYSQAMKYLEIKNVIDEKYVGTVNEESVSAAAFDAMVSALGDQWSYYMSPSEYSAYKLYSANQYVGLGVQVDKDAETGGLKITGVNSGTPADNAGLEAGDIILAVAGTDITGMTVGDARSFISSNLGESVKLKIRDKDGNESELSVNCELIYTSPVTYRMLSGSIGYVQILNFDSGAADAAVKAIETLLGQGALGFVFDVRTNPGGLLSELTTLLDYLLPSGNIFISVDKAGNQTPTESDSVCLDMPMAVLVNADTYSAAEFFAAALQDYNWAEIVGERTTGKSRSQQTIELSDGSAVHLSTARYLTPAGIDLAEQGGLIPDQEVALTATGDSQLNAALSAVQWMM